MNTSFLNLLKLINIPNIISSTNKSLNIVKKTIPVYKEIRPYIRHEKKLFKPITNTNIDEIKESKPIKPHNNKITYNDSLTFFN